MISEGITWRAYAEAITSPEWASGLVEAFGVITAQIGELKSEIVHNGDMLNTTARIQALCNELGHRFLVSAEPMGKLSLGPNRWWRAWDRCRYAGRARRPSSTP